MLVPENVTGAALHSTGIPVDETLAIAVKSIRMD